MCKPSETNKPFPLVVPAMQSLYAELEAAVQQCSFDSRTSNIYGAFLIDIASGRGLTTLSQHLCFTFLREPYFFTEGMVQLTELPQSIPIQKLDAEFDAELESVRRFGRFRGMMVVDLSAFERSDEKAFKRFIEHVSSYKNDIVFVFRTNPKVPQQFNHVLQLISCRFLVRSSRVVERDNRHYYLKALDQLKAIGSPCPLDLEDAVNRIVDTIVDGASFMGFETVVLVAQEIAVCAQRNGANRLTADVLNAYCDSELYAAHIQVEPSKKMGF